MNILITRREVTTSARLTGTAYPVYDRLALNYRTKMPKTMPCPAARPRIGHIGEYPTPSGNAPPLTETIKYILIKFRPSFEYV